MGDQRGETGEIVNYIIQRKLNSTAEGDREFTNHGGENGDTGSMWNHMKPQPGQENKVNTCECCRRTRGSLLPGFQQRDPCIEQ